MKIAQISYSDYLGGASRAAFRLHCALRDAGVESTMHVALARSGDPTVIGPTSDVAQGLSLLRNYLGRLPSRLLLKTDNPIIHSSSILPSSRPRQINQSDADIAHLHWVCNEVMSVEGVSHIRKPVVWTLHDMWAFCGAEHCAWDERYRDGYTRANRPNHESGFDLNSWVWNRKRRAWRQPMQIVTPSRWLAECAKRSVLMREWPITVIPHALDTTTWQPMDRVTARRLLGLRPDCRLLAFNAVGGAKYPHKGVDLLFSALDHLHGEMQGLELVVFGAQRPRVVPTMKFPIHYTGYLYDDLSLRLLYSAVDAIVIPSRQESLSLTGVEALACGTPVIAFNACGLPDVVTHQRTGWLAKAFDTEDLATGIRWVLGDDERLRELGRHARQDAEQRFAAPVVARQYKQLYETLLAAS